MSDEKPRRRDESESESAGDEVVAHRYVFEGPDEDDPEKKRKRKLIDEPADDEPGRRKK